MNIYAHLGKKCGILLKKNIKARYKVRGNMLKVNGETKQLAIIGNPVSHSFSPKMHNYISEKMNLNYVYTALKVEENDFDAAIDGIRAFGIAGVNITSPYKSRAYDRMDVLSDRAKRYGAVNTCVNRDGVLYGYNTDAEGFYLSLKREGIEIKDRDVLFIGAGGVTGPVMMYFADIGAKSISIVNRTISKAEELAKITREMCDCDVNVGIDKKHYDVVINTTTVGMHPDINKFPVNEIPYIDNETAVADMIYNPDKTMFLKMAEKKGAKTINGLGMLIYQGIIAYELFTGAKLSDTIYDDILKDVFKK